MTADTSVATYPITTWSTVGLGAERYAQVAALLYGHRLEVAGIAHEIRRVVPKFDVPVICECFRRNGYALVDGRIDMTQNCPKCNGSKYIPNKRDGVAEWNVYVAEADAVRAKNAPALDRREWVRRCWSYACQPRVFDPYLPAGFEEQNRLDYQGGSRS